MNKIARATAPQPPSDTIGMIRITRVSYDHHPIERGSPGVTLGEMIDHHIRETLRSGDMVQEVTLSFEDELAQYELARLYQ